MLEGNKDYGGRKASAPSNGDGQTYKVLVLDRFCRDLLAPLMRVNDLRKHGVTLHLMLESERQPIPDVAAVYLMQVTLLDAPLASPPPLPLPPGLRNPPTSLRIPYGAPRQRKPTWIAS